MRSGLRRALFFLIMLLYVWSHPVMAHKVIVFAWVESGIIHIEGSFGGKNKVHNGVIEVTNDQGQTVFKGRTDEKGYVSFDIPTKVDSDLTVILEAGTAHKAKWLIPREDLISTASPDSLVQQMETKEHLEESPSMVKVIFGIGIIFLIAFLAHRIRKKKMTRS